MYIHSVVRRLAVATLAAFAITAGTTTMAGADETNGKDLVTFGDSYTANGGIPGERRTDSPYTIIKGCPQDTQNWPHQAAKLRGESLGDYSCNGTSIWVDQYVNAAIDNGDIGPNTKNVVFMYGGLQVDLYTDTLNSTITGSSNLPSNYVWLMHRQVEKIHRAAPNARINMVTYPQISTNDVVCLYNDGGVSVPVGFPGLTATEEKINDQIRNTASRIGANVLDVHDASKTHDSCQPDPSHRWVTMIKAKEAPSVMPAHPTDVGHTRIGAVVANELG